MCAHPPELEDGLALMESRHRDLSAQLEMTGSGSGLGGEGGGATSSTPLGATAPLRSAERDGLYAEVRWSGV